MWRLPSKWKWIFLALGILCLCQWCSPEEIRAGVFDDANTFFDTYGDEIIFQPAPDGNGTFYYGTKDRIAGTVTGTTYETIGWRVTVKNSNGVNLDTIYYALGGNYLDVVHSEIIGRFEYILYSVTLDELKSRMSQTAREALAGANCRIVFDACNIIRIDGVAQGGVTDAGISWGTVYTSYEGIANVVDWADATKADLSRHYNKNIDGLFYSVTLSCGEGIASVSGSGNYCYGTQVQISATPETGYAFARWEGSYNSSEQYYEFLLLNSAVSMTAYGVRSGLTITYHENVLSTQEREETVYYRYGVDGQKLLNPGWRRAGSYLKGWALDSETGTADYSLGQSINDTWIEAQGNTLDLYAVWGSTRFTIIYDANGGKGRQQSNSGTYMSTVTTPKTGYTCNGATLIGWSYRPDASTADFSCGERVRIMTLANATGNKYGSSVTIRLYAQWDQAPRIVADDLYVSLEDAMTGKITEAWLAARAEVSDGEDGVLSYGRGDGATFYLLDYSPTDFTEFEKPGSVTQTYYARDSVGNEVQKRIRVYVVDVGVEDKKRVDGEVRFISERYLKHADGSWVSGDEGGLSEDSKWIWMEEYRKLLESALES